MAEAGLFDGTVTSAEERRDFVALLALAPSSRLLEIGTQPYDAAGGSFDAVLCIDAIAELRDRATALAEWARIVKPGGRVLLLELRRHDEQWVRERLGDTWLGFDDAELKRMLEGAGLTGVRVTVGARRQRDPFTVLIASGTKTAHGRRTKATKVAKTHKSVKNAR